MWFAKRQEFNHPTLPKGVSLATVAKAIAAIGDASLSKKADLQGNDTN